MAHRTLQVLIFYTFVSWDACCWNNFSSQLNCCGPTGTVIDGAKDICPKKEGMEIFITKVANCFLIFFVLYMKSPKRDQNEQVVSCVVLNCISVSFAALRAVQLPSTRCSTTNCTSSVGSASVSASSWWVWKTRLYQWLSFCAVLFLWLRVGFCGVLALLQACSKSVID